MSPEPKKAIALSFTLLMAVPSMASDISKPKHT